jgi:hypothetical protein
MFAHVSQASSAIKAANHPSDIIYQAAKEKNAVKIAAALLQVCIDVQKTGSHDVPVSRLAAERDIDSVSFLRDQVPLLLKM